MQVSRKRKGPRLNLREAAGRLSWLPGHAAVRILVRGVVVCETWPRRGVLWTPGVVVVVIRKPAWIVGALLFALVPGVVFAHGNGEGPSIGRLLFAWELDPLFIVPAGGAVWLYLAAVGRVNKAHPKSPYPRRRTAFFLGGVAVLSLAIVSPPAAYDTTLFSVHMGQHLLITMVAAPLILLGAPITLALRVASRTTRKNVLLPLLHSRFVRFVSFPVFAWLLFAGTMWGSHFSPLFNAALEDAWIHRAEHALYLSVALVFWWQVIGLDPTPWRMNHPVRMLYVFLQMPQNSFLALAIYSADDVIYKHYATVQRDWGPSPLADQQIAGISMWIGGDLLFLAALAVVIAGWVKAEELEAKRQDKAQARRKAEAAGPVS
ncbi:MAG: hypothetical protein C0506_03880 [Anaerolinea sp.]|nr:hypothetical protein [Anaerolinea sp.]